MATEDENPSQLDITTMLQGQTSACEAARDAISAGGEVILYDGQVPHWMVFGIAARRLRWSLKIGLTTVGLDETVEILRARHPDELLRTGLGSSTCTSTPPGPSSLRAAASRTSGPRGRTVRSFSCRGRHLYLPQLLRGGQRPAGPQGGHRRSYRRRPQTGAA
ncbi:hypothetical protein [Streptomyces sp. NPDC001068]|uniref:hypothetical protein n=1 Tax=Streptomyces sp. NPDC001068 TaxID=3364544 RepID=UPI00367CFC26